jgi:segregation and condensation protein A
VALVQRRLRLLREAEADAVLMPVPKIITIADVRERIDQLMATQTWFSFEDLLSFSLTRQEVIVTLWTVLELFKRGAIVFEQQQLFGPIMIGRGPMYAECGVRDAGREDPDL